MHVVAFSIFPHGYFVQSSNQTCSYLNSEYRPVKKYTIFYFFLFKIVTIEYLFLMLIMSTRKFIILSIGALTITALVRGRWCCTLTMKRALFIVSISLYYTDDLMSSFNNIR